jgi:hypothetical protein
MINNIRLFEVLTRHQIYVEGVKAHHAIEFNKVLQELDKEFLLLFAKLHFATLDGLTKAKLRSFLIEMRKIQSRVYSKYTKKLIGEMQDFMNADVLVSKSIFATLQKPEDEDEEPIDEEESDEALDEALAANEDKSLYPIGWFKSPQNGGTPDKLWSAITNAPIPANGMLMLPFIASFVGSAMLNVESIVRKGYANRSTIQSVLAEIRGTAARNHRDGALNKINSQGNAVTDTAIQHVTSIAQAGVASIFYGKYRWVSVIDSGTTEICKGRNNRVFKYGAGPLPPAHIRCRSKTVPVVPGNDGDLPSSYYEFMINQPKTVQDDILGETKAANLRNKKTKRADMPQFDDANPLTVDGFKAKLKLILTR